MSKFTKKTKHSQGSNGKKPIQFSRSTLVDKLNPTAQALSLATRGMLKNLFENERAYPSKYKHYLKPGDDVYVYFVDDKGREQKTRIGKALQKAGYTDILKRYQQERSITNEESKNITKVVQRVEEAIKNKVPENPLEKITGTYNIPLNTIKKGQDHPLRLIISQNPIDITLKSTTRAWENQSCERIGGQYGNPSSERCGFASDIKNNNAIAYIYDEGINEWLGRWMIRWCKLDDGNIEARIENLYKQSDLPNHISKSARNVLEDQLTRALLYEKPYEQCCVKYNYLGFSDLGNPNTGKVCYGETCLNGIELDLDGNVCLFLDEYDYDRSNAENKYLVVEILDTGQSIYYLDKDAGYIFSRNLNDQDSGVSINGIKDAFERLVEYHSGMPISIKEGILQYIEIFKGGYLNARELDDAYDNFVFNITPQTNFYIALDNNIAPAHAEYWERPYPTNPKIVLEDHVKLQYSFNTNKTDVDHDDLYEIMMGPYKGKWLRKQASRYQNSPEYDAEIIEIENDDELKEFLETEFKGRFFAYDSSAHERLK